jgi:hypothetical protein
MPFRPYDALAKFDDRGGYAMNRRIALLAGTVLVAAIARLLPHPPNVTPIAAMALFAGAYLPNRRFAFAFPLAAMLLSDLALGYFVYGGKSLLHSQPVVYACMLCTVATGMLISNRRSAVQVGLAALASSIFFYVVTNFAVWVGGHLYPHTGAGLTACYVAAIPFFHNSVIGDLAFAALLFGGFALLETRLPSLREETRVPA